MYIFVFYPVFWLPNNTLGYIYIYIYISHCVISTANGLNLTYWLAVIPEQRTSSTLRIVKCHDDSHWQRTAACNIITRGFPVKVSKRVFTWYYSFDQFDKWSIDWLVFYGTSTQVRSICANLPGGLLAQAFQDSQRGTYKNIQLHPIQWTYTCNDKQQVCLTCLKINNAISLTKEDHYNGNLQQCLCKHCYHVICAIIHRNANKYHVISHNFGRLLLVYSHINVFITL